MITSDYLTFITQFQYIEIHSNRIWAVICSVKQISYDI